MLGIPVRIRSDRSRRRPAPPPERAPSKERFPSHHRPKGWDHPPPMGSCPVWMLLKQKREGESRHLRLHCFGPEVAIAWPELVNAPTKLGGNVGTSS